MIILYLALFWLGLSHPLSCHCASERHVPVNRIAFRETDGGGYDFRKPDQILISIVRKPHCALRLVSHSIISTGLFAYPEPK